jgi:predicted metal-dependent enzyme (double-stranded beta helix superfamily)
MHPTAPPSLDSRTLADVAAQVAARVHRSHQLPGTGRRYRRVDVGGLDAHVDAWLIAWPAGTGLPMHDHAGSSAVIQLIRSTLRERFLDDDRVLERWLRPGQPVLLPPTHWHEVVNDSDDEALSLHVYSPKLTTLRFRSEFASWRSAAEHPVLAEAGSTS